MKKIVDMTPDEIKQEIRERLKQHDQNRGFAFISYSHRDADKVYPKVLEWMREGYNIYLDLDFENHGSDENWVDIMQGKLRRKMCRLAICFRSINYYYSYAAMIEVLTMRSNWTTGQRLQQVLPIDVLNISEIPKTGEEIPKELEAEYVDYFNKLCNNMGDSFCKNNPHEKELLETGISSWVNRLSEEHRKELGYTPGQPSAMDNLIQAYEDGYSEFFPAVFFIVSNWFAKENLNGNNKDMKTDMTARFVETKIYIHSPAASDAKAGEADAKKSAAQKAEKQTSEVQNSQQPDHEIHTVVDTAKADEPSEVCYHFTNKKGSYDAYILGPAEAVYRQLRAQGIKGSFTVLAGSRLKDDTAASCPLKTRSSIMQNNADAQLRLTSNQPFTSPSNALALVTGTSISGEDLFRNGVVIPKPEFESAPVFPAPVSDNDIVEDELSDVVEIENVADEEEESAKPEQDRKKPFSLTGDITYTLYGKSHTENQSKMMLRFFAQVLRRHQDKTLTLAEQPGMNCVSYIDYTKPENKTPDMPSYFRNCHYFPFPEGKAICVGTAYSSGDKLKKMAMLLQICGESRDIFQSDQLELPEIRASHGNRGKSSLVSYTAYGKHFSTNQANMLGNIISLTLSRHPDKLDDAAKALTSVDLRDYNDVPKEQRTSSYFNTFNAYKLNGRVYSVGGGFGMQEKLNQIARLLTLCGEPLSAVVIEGYELKASGKQGKKVNTADEFDDFLND
ncbi:MAG: hypothetical protein IJQ02_03815 [Oscillospiraceae bacterium]|nr:hypothetical protein [Oscillospiraceae bacterium]